MSGRDAVAFASGLLFAVGLGVAQMTQPAKVLGFLDVAGAWDPSLAFVMVGAIGVHALFVRRATKAERPRFAAAFAWPEAKAIDARLLAGAALFGIGWGVSGFCPGPALVSVVSLSAKTVAFVVAMLGGMALHRLVVRTTP
ncbi:YeeE/YedE family protein [Pendulispora rubella]|uniref:YeeE/YedE family protein n=1 Tax=Pendulispora rubella TaxID=2741070 RepID=A0ABZ2LAU2_9BACT